MLDWHLTKGKEGTRMARIVRIRVEPLSDAGEWRCQGSQHFFVVSDSRRIEKRRMRMLARAWILPFEEPHVMYVGLQDRWCRRRWSRGSANQSPKRRRSSPVISSPVLSPSTLRILLASLLKQVSNDSEDFCTCTSSRTSTVQLQIRADANFQEFLRERVADTAALSTIGYMSS